MRQWPQIDELQKKLQTGNNYISALEDCCDNAGFSVAAVKQGALDEVFTSESTIVMMPQLH